MQCPDYLRVEAGANHKEEHLVPSLTKVKRYDDSLLDRSANRICRRKLAEETPEQVFRSHRNIQERDFERHMISHYGSSPVAADGENSPQFARFLTRSRHSIERIEVCRHEDFESANLQGGFDFSDVLVTATCSCPRIHADEDSTRTDGRRSGQAR